MNKYFIYLLLFLIPFMSNGQADSLTSNSSVVRLNMKEGLIINQEIDTTLSNYHYFYPHYSDFISTNGNMGTPVVRMEWNYNPDWLLNFQDNYSIYANRLVGNIVSNKPYTKLFYSNGTKEEQYFNVVHSQRIKKGWNITGELDKINSTGFYTNQKTDNTLVNISSSYLSKDDRFIQLSNYRFSRFSSQENGGLVDDMDFEDDFTDKLYISTNLSNASNVVRTHQLVLENYLRLSKTDTLNDNSSNFLVGKVYLTDSKQIYKDSNIDSLYYTMFGFAEGESIQDSLHYQIVKAKVGWQNFNPIETSRMVLASFFGGYEFNDFYLNDFGKQLHTTIVSGRVGTNPTNSLIAGFDFKFRYNMLGDPTNKTNLNLKLGYKLDSLKETKIWFSGYYDLSSPNYRYYLNWPSLLVARDLAEIRTIDFGLNFSSEKMKNVISVNYISLSNAVYLDSLYQVKQNSGASNLFKVSIKQQFKVGKFHLLAKLLYQKVQGDDVFRVPEFVVFNSLYFESNLFKKATLMRVGMDFYYNTAYYANGYLPMYRSFYFQDEKQIGGYPYFDVFIMAQIKKARVYAKVSHVNSGLMGNTYYSSLHYPMADRMLRLGVDWTFWD